MNKDFWDRKIPTLLGMILIIIGLSVTTLLTNQQTVFQIGAQINTQPQNVRITNITSTSFTITYTTIEKTTGYINYGLGNILDKTIFNEAENDQKLNNHTVHSFTVNNLSPNTTYNFIIVSGKEKYLDNNSNFKINTAPSIFNSNSQNQISGTVILPNSSAPSEAIIYAKIDGAQTLSTLVSKSGSYTLDFSNLLSQDFSSQITISEGTLIKLLILGDSQTSTATIYYNQNLNVPTIVLSNDYDFRYQEKSISSPSGILNSFPSIEKINLSKEIDKLKIISPNSETYLNNQKPTIKGTALPNQEVKISIHSTQEIDATVSTDASGNWNYQPSTDLEPGIHTITASSKDSSGLIKTITQKFTVYAQEISPTPTPSPTSTLINETTPTISPSLQKLPVVGSPSIIAAGIVGLLISVTGGLVFLLSRKIT